MPLFDPMLQRRAATGRGSMFGTMFNPQMPTAPPPSPFAGVADRGSIANAFNNQAVLGSGAQAGRAAQFPALGGTSHILPPQPVFPVRQPNRGVVHDVMRDRGGIGRGASQSRGDQFYDLMGVPRGFQGAAGAVPTRSIRRFGPFASMGV